MSTTEPTPTDEGLAIEITVTLDGEPVSGQRIVTAVDGAQQALDNLVTEIIADIQASLDARAS